MKQGLLFRSASVGVAAVVLASAGLSANAIIPQDSAQAVTATTGSGNFRDIIDWVPWGRAGDTVVGRDTAAGFEKQAVSERILDAATDTKLVTTCTVNNFDFQTGPYTYTVNKGSQIEGQRVNGDVPRAPADQVRTRQLTNVDPVIAYQPGAWRADGFPVMYGTPTTDDGQVVGLRSSNRGPNVTSFDLSCSAELFEGAKKITDVPVSGLVVADAESLKNNYLFDEFIQLAPVGGDVSWHVLDQYRDPDNARYPYGTPTASINDEFVQLLPDGSAKLTAQNEDETRRKAATLYAKGASAARVTLGGAGATGIAVGSIAELDFGDAPNSYGLAGALMQNAIAGGNAGLTVGGPKVNLTNGTFTTATAPVFTNGVSAPITAGPLLGASKTVERVTWHGINEDSDDGLTGLDDILLPSTPDAGVDYPVTLACTAPDAGEGYVQGWIDFNHNGQFDAGEESDSVLCANGSATITFKVKADQKSWASTVLRFRTSRDATMQPTGITSFGEVEDYQRPILVTRDAETTGPQAKTQLSKDQAPADGDLGKQPEEMFPGLTAIDPAPKFHFDGGADETTKDVPGVGVYTIDPDTGVVTFEPDPNFTGTAAPIKVQATATGFLDADGNTVSRTLTANYTVTVTPTEAKVVDAEKLNQQVGTPIVIDNLVQGIEDANDPNKPSIDIATLRFTEQDQPAGATIEDGGRTLKVPGEGVWEIAADGTVTFTPDPAFTGLTPQPVKYTGSDANGAPAVNVGTLTVSYSAPVRVANAAKLDQQRGSAVSVTPEYPAAPANVAAGEKSATPGVDLATVVFTDDNQPVGAVVSEGGKKLTVEGEGVWTISAEGVFTFTPEAGFTGNPTRVSYTATDTNGYPVVNNAYIEVSYKAAPVAPAPVTPDPAKPQPGKPAPVKISPAGVPPVKLATTGSDNISLFAGSALALVALGGVLVAVRRLRTR